MEKGDGWLVRNKYDGSTGRLVLVDERQVPASFPKNLLTLNENEHENGIIPFCLLSSIDMRDLELTYHILVLFSDSHLLS